jgi:hypothetical protein
MTLQPLESQVIAKVADEYRRRGYDVAVKPSGADLPDFLGDFKPDLIARNGTESVVVEVKVGTRTSVAERLWDVAEKVNVSLAGGFRSFSSTQTSLMKYPKLSLHLRRCYRNEPE